ncbi:MAG: transposase [Alcanivoracaceae bacterium]|nr:transposase [Alcanivoracaceae bacterium]
MTLPRKQLISIEATPFYHIITRCVRRAFLCGKDTHSGNCYEHRRKLIVDRIKELAGVFNIDVCAYAIMSNHYHLVLKVNCTNDWSERKCLIDWSSLCKIPDICQRYIKHEGLSKAELAFVYLQADVYRKRLMDISWFMKLLNEHIARSANIEDNVTGSFWESRFKSQALLDERALLTCMVYVDLNPVRAAIAKTPEGSDYTSIQERIMTKKSDLLNIGFGENDIPYTLTDYCDLVDATGRAIIIGKTGSIPADLPPILKRLNLNESTWLNELNQFKNKGQTAAGTVQQLKAFCKSVHKKCRRGIQLVPALE